MRITDESAVSTTEIPQTWTFESLKVRVRLSSAPTLFSRKTENCLTSGCCSLSRTLDSDFAISPPHEFHPNVALDDAKANLRRLDAPVRVDVLHLQEVNDVGHAFRRGLFVRVDHQLGSVGRLIRRGDAGEVGNLTSAGLLVEALRITLFANFERGVHVHFHELALVDQRARQPAVIAVRRDKSRDDQHTRVHEQPRNLRHPPDVLSAVLGRKSQVGAKTVADVVAVENIVVQTLCEKLALQFCGHSRFTGTGQAREPKDGALVSIALLARLARDLASRP